MPCYDFVEGTLKEVKEVYDMVGGVPHEVDTGYDYINGVLREYHSSWVLLSTLPVGTTVYMNVNKVRTAFIIVHQGLPDAVKYGSSCDGTWLLMRDIYENRAWDNVYNHYRESDIHAYLNGTFLNLFDSSIRSNIKQAKIPHVDGHVGAGTSIPSVSQGSYSNGLLASIFLLSSTEINGGYYRGKEPEGVLLDYFRNSPTSPIRIAYYNGNPGYWFTRTPHDYNPDCINIREVEPNGDINIYAEVQDSSGIRPALILPSTLKVKSSFDIVA